MKLVLGWAERRQLEDFAAKIDVASYLDVDKVFSSAARVGGVPTWLVLDDEGRVLTRMTGHYGSAEEQLRALGLSEP